VQRWKNAAKRSKRQKPVKSILKKRPEPEVAEKFDPLSVLTCKTVNNKSKMADLILHTVATNQVSTRR
jgi:hypothetical protein